MKLREWDYNHGPSGGWVEVEYPDEIIKEFVDYFRVNKQWRERDDMTDMVFRRFKHFQDDLAEVRNERALADAADVPVACTRTTRAGKPCKNTTGVVNGVCAVHRRTLVAA